MRKIVYIGIVLIPVVVLCLVVFFANYSQSDGSNNLAIPEVQHAVDLYFDVAKLFLSFTMALIGIAWAYIVSEKNKEKWYSSLVFSNIISGFISIAFYLKLTQNIILKEIVHKRIEIQSDQNSFYHDWQINFFIFQLILITLYVICISMEKQACSKK